MLAALGGVGISIAVTEYHPPWASAWFITGIVLCGLACLSALWALVLHVGLAETVSWRGKRIEGVGDWRAVGDADPIALGVHRPETSAGVTGLQAYAERDLHEPLVELIPQGGFVYLRVTRPSARPGSRGKPRAKPCRDGASSRRIPRRNWAGLAHQNLKRTVVRLDDLEKVLKLTALSTRACWTGICPEGGAVTVLATLRLAEKDRLLKEQKDTMRELLARGRVGVTSPSSSLS